MLRTFFLVVLAIFSLASRSADACSPAPGCGDRICSFATGFLDATIVAVASDGSGVTLTPQAVFGDAAELAVGVEVTLPARSIVISLANAGQRRYVYLERSETALLVSAVMDPADPDFAECLGADATTSTIATQILSPDCNIQLISHRPPSSCEDSSCNAGGPRGAWMLVLVGAFAFGRRRRTRHGAMNR